MLCPPWPYPLIIIIPYYIIVSAVLYVLPVGTQNSQNDLSKCLKMKMLISVSPVSLSTAPTER